MRCLIWVLAICFATFVGLNSALSAASPEANSVVCEDGKKESFIIGAVRKAFPTATIKEDLRGERLVFFLEKYNAEPPPTNHSTDNVDRAVILEKPDERYFLVLLGYKGCMVKYFHLIKNRFNEFVPAASRGA